MTWEITKGLFNPENMRDNICRCPEPNPINHKCSVCGGQYVIQSKENKGTKQVKKKEGKK